MRIEEPFGNVNIIIKFICKSFSICVCVCVEGWDYGCGDSSEFLGTSVMTKRLAGIYVRATVYA